MSQWPAAKARRVFAALLRIGWSVKRESGSHRTLTRQGRPDFVFAFHDSEEIGPRMLARIAKHTGLTPDELQIPLMWAKKPWQCAEGLITRHVPEHERFEVHNLVPSTIVGLPPTMLVEQAWPSPIAGPVRLRA